MDPHDAAELARRMRAAVVEEKPRHRWVAPATAVLVLAIVVFLVAMSV